MMEETKLQDGVDIDIEEVIGDDDDLLHAYSSCGRCPVPEDGFMALTICGVISVSHGKERCSKCNEIMKGRWRIEGQLNIPCWRCGRVAS